MATHAARLRAAVRAVCGARPAPGYAGAPTMRPNDAALEVLSPDATREGTYLLLDVGSQKVAVDSAGQLAWASESQVAGRATVLLGRRAAGVMPPSLLAPRHAEQARQQLAFGASVEEAAAADFAGVAGFVGLRQLVGSCSTADAAMACQARNLLLWHRQHAFCGTCGAPTAAAKAGWRRDCSGCGLPHFPRTDPVVIAAVLSPDGRAALLGRQKKWPADRYSCLAGFVDPGESMEEAVRREVREEAGVAIGARDVFYHSSQPWPLGPASQLMLGAIAVAAPTDATESGPRSEPSRHPRISIDPDELDVARWVEMDELRDALARARASGPGAAPAPQGTSGALPPSTQRGSAPGQLMVPEPLAIAHQLLSSCADELQRQL